MNCSEYRMNSKKHIRNNLRQNVIFPKLFYQFFTPTLIELKQLFTLIFTLILNFTFALNSHFPNRNLLTHSSKFWDGQLSFVKIHPYKMSHIECSWSVHIEFLSFHFHLRLLFSYSDRPLLPSWNKNHSFLNFSHKKCGNSFDL